MTLQALEEIGAVLQGHFLLTSGRHSALYFEKFRLLERPDRLMPMVAQLLEPLREYRIEAVVGPTLGGVIVAYECARQLGVPAFYAEREGEARAFRRGSELPPNGSILVVDDVLTTGTSIREVLELLERLQVKVCAVGVLIDRSEPTPDFGVPLYSALRIPAESYAPEACPLCEQGIPLVKRGSR